MRHADNGCVVTCCYENASPWPRSCPHTAFPLQSVTAEEDDETLEARETWAEFFPDSESTILQWRNIETTDGLLLDQLKMATYEIHRSENGRFFANAHA